MVDAVSTRNPMARVMSLHDFRLLFAGSATSLLGDQFALIATPWLVLRLTGDPLTLGIVMALGGLPRAAIILVGGAVTDRISPRVLMLVCDIVRLALTGLMAFVVFAGAVQMWMLYAFALLFGLISGFAIPAQECIVPVLVPEDDLQAGNSLIMGLGQLAAFIGPSLAGILIGGYAQSLTGIGLAFAIDAFTFAVSAVCLWLIRGGRRAQSTGDSEESNLWASILEGMKYLWGDESFRLMFLVMLAVNFLLIGPMLVGIPVLADQRLPEGALAFGLLMSADAGGNLLGYLLAGALPRPSGMALRVVMITVLVIFGLAFGGLAFIRSTWVGAGLLFIEGFGNGYFIILFWTWVQTRSRKDMLGRVMSIMMFGAMGLVPLSQAISGVVSKWNLDMLLIGTGVLSLLVAAWTMFQPALKTLSDGMAAGPASGL